MNSTKSKKVSSLLIFVVFLVLNFTALGIGGLFTGEGVPSEWYKNLSRAPWEPPGWVFGAAWTTIMLALAVFMTLAWNKVEQRKNLIIIYGVQWILNVLWNPLFFYMHWTEIALVEIVLLTLWILMMVFVYRTEMKWAILLLFPYAVWLCIATSLNGYVVFYN